VFIRTFIYSKINTFGLPNLSKISFAFNIFFLIPVQGMFCLKVVQNIIPMEISVSENSDQKTYPKKCRGGFSPLSPPWIRLCFYVLPALSSQLSVSSKLCMMNTLLHLLLLLCQLCHCLSNVSFDGCILGFI